MSHSLSEKESEDEKPSTSLGSNIPTATTEKLDSAVGIENSIFREVISGFDFDWNQFSGLLDKQYVGLSEVEEKAQISTAESELVDKLRLLCDSNGRENMDHFHGIASLLFQLGKLYLSEIDNKSRLQQKLHIIQCSVLLNGAKARFRQDGIASMIEEVDETLMNLHQKVATLIPNKDNLEMKRFTLSHISVMIFKRIEILRRDIDNKFAEILQVDHPLLSEEDEDLVEKEKEKIRRVNEVLEYWYAEFIEISRLLSEKCSSILKPSPCKFCQVGVGSLARMEATPFSDFEHVIILEEGIQDEDILEYFRWFSVINQLIIIGFGETSIKNVAINSLDWFSDAFLPTVGTLNHCGDTWMKRNPIGVHLITPVSSMLNYLSRPGEMVNGYYLREILQNTCFVYGDEALHETYRKQACELLTNKQEGDSSFEAADDVQKDEKTNIFMFFSNPFDVSLKLRSRHAYSDLHTLARLNGIRFSTNFEIIEKLERKNVFNSKLAHEMRLAVAVLSEIRNKTHIRKINQRGNVPLKKLISVVGKHSFMRMSCTWNTLHKLIKEERGEESFPLHKEMYWIYRGDILFKAFVLMKMLCFDECEQLLKPEIDELFQRTSLFTSTETLHYGIALQLFLAATCTKMESDKLSAQNFFEQICSIEQYIPDAVDGRFYLPWYFAVCKIEILRIFDMEKAFLELEKFRGELQRKVDNEDVDESLIIKFDFALIPILLEVKQFDLFSKRAYKCLRLLKYSRNSNDSMFKSLFRSIIPGSKSVQTVINNEKLVKKCVGNSGLTKDEGEDDMVSETELELVAKLCSMCSIDGKENRKYLTESAVFLFQIGKLYLTEIDGKSGLQQKLHFIRCSTLLNGAKVRLQLREEWNRNRIREVDDALKTLQQKLFVLAPVKHDKNEINLVDLSRGIFERITDLRTQTTNKLSLILRIDYSVLSEDEDPQLVEMEKKKIQQVEEITDFLYDQVLGILQEISEECLKILKPIPCKFCQVGLGSLARKETTPYSDFEHLIIVEEELDNYEEILEYFRWFAVINQLIFINFGETFIKSVAMKSMDWFYDAVTPVGFSYDGMAPQASSNPLGRMPTKNKPFRVELIKPVSEMVEYLSVQQQLKNGYYLHEILKNTCFVYGDETLYKKFRKKAEQKVQEGSDFEKENQALLISNNVLPEVKHMMLSRRNDLTIMKSAFNVKSQIYRPISVNLTALARVNSIKSNSNFDIVDELERKMVFDTKVAHEMRLAVAVSNEIRNKTYTFVKNQRGNIPFDKLISIVGKHSMVKLFCARCKLLMTVSSIIPSKETYGEEQVLEDRTFFHQDGKLLKGYVLASMSFYEECERLLQPDVDELFQANSMLTPRQAKYYGGVLHFYLVATFRKIEGRPQSLQKIVGRISAIERYIPGTMEGHSSLPSQFVSCKISLMEMYNEKRAFAEGELFRTQLQKGVGRGDIGEIFLVTFDYNSFSILKKMNRFDLISSRSDRCLKFWKRLKASNEYGSQTAHLKYFCDAKCEAEAVNLDGKATLALYRKLSEEYLPSNMDKVSRMRAAAETCSNLQNWCSTKPAVALKIFDEVLAELGDLHENLTLDELELFDDVARSLMECQVNLYLDTTPGYKYVYIHFDKTFGEKYLAKRKKCGFTQEPIRILFVLFELHMISLYPSNASEIQETGTSRLQKKIAVMKERMAVSVRLQNDNEYRYTKDVVEMIGAAFFCLPVSQALEIYKNSSVYKTPENDPANFIPSRLLKRFFFSTAFLHTSAAIEEAVTSFDCLFEHFTKFMCCPELYFKSLIGMQAVFQATANGQSHIWNLMEKARSIFLSEFKLRCSDVPENIRRTYESALLWYGFDSKASCRALYSVLLKCTINPPGELRGDSVQHVVVERCISLLYGIMMYNLKLH